MGVMSGRSMSGSDAGSVVLCVVLILLLTAAVFVYFQYHTAIEQKIDEVRHRGEKDIHGAHKSHSTHASESPVKKLKEAHAPTFDHSAQHVDCFTCCDAHSHDAHHVSDPHTRAVADWTNDAMHHTEAATKNAQAHAQKYAKQGMALADQQKQTLSAEMDKAKGQLDKAKGQSQQAHGFMDHFRTHGK